MSSEIKRQPASRAFRGPRSAYAAVEVVAGEERGKYCEDEEQGSADGEKNLPSFVGKEDAKEEGELATDGPVDLSGDAPYKLQVELAMCNGIERSRFFVLCLTENFLQRASGCGRGVRPARASSRSRRAFRSQQ